jgi:plasmid maintenance system antidote protein VapI
VYRQDRELSQAALGRGLGGLSRQNVSDMENGRRPIGRRMAERLGRFFDVSPRRFFA